MRFALPVLVFVVAASAPQLAAAQRGPVGVLDMQRALVECPDGRRAQAELRRLFLHHQSELDRLQRVASDLRERVLRASPSARPVLEAQYREKLAQLEALHIRFQQELAREETRLTHGIIRRLRQTADVIRRERGLSVVLELTDQQPPRGPGAAVDVTDEVIRRVSSAP